VPADALAVQDIVAYQYEFNALFVSLQNLRHILSGWPEFVDLAREAPAQTAPLAQIRADMISQIAAAQEFL
jgi:hypothetical protein